MSLTVAQAYRYCGKCMCLFRAGEFSAPGTPKGICPAGDAHKAEGLRFEIPANGPPSATAQNRWVSCGFCWAMFYNGVAQKGSCPGNARGHRKDEDFDLNFAVSHDVFGVPSTQAEWRYCRKCFVMFYNGFASRGVCNAGGEHAPEGFNFVLPHR